MDSVETQTQASASTTVIPCPPAGHAMLTTVLKRLRIDVEARAFFDTQPGLAAIAARLTWLISHTPIYHFTGRPIIDHCIEEGWRSAISARKRSGNMPEAFLGSMLMRSALLQEVQLADDIATWNPLVDPPYIEWCSRHPDAAPRETDNPAPSIVDALAFRRALKMRLIDPAEMRDVLGEDGWGLDE